MPIGQRTRTIRAGLRPRNSVVVRLFQSACAASLLVAAPAFSQSAEQEARFVDAVRMMEARNVTFYVSVDPRFEPLLTPPAETPDYLDRQRCFLARLESDGGAEMMEEYIAAAEDLAEKEITSLIELGQSLPEVMMADVVFAASAECGALTYTTEQMVTPEFLELMDDPDVMQGLMGG